MTRLSRQPILAFLAIAFALSIACGTVAWATGGDRSPYAFALGLTAMLAPAAAALTVQSTMNEGLRIDWNRLPFRYLPIALLLMPVTMQAIVLVHMSFAGPLPWQEWLTPRSG